MNNFKKAGAYIGFFFICILAHFLIMRFGLKSETDFTSIYIFTATVNILTLLLITELNTFFHKYLGFIFIAIIALKLMVAKFFMDNSVNLDNPEEKYTLLILYLLSLVLITVFTAKLLLKPEK